MAAEQLALAADCCKVKGCPRPVVGHSVTGKGKVCKGHNEADWGAALREYDPPMSAALLAASSRTLEATDA
jgi:hypothetical protein